MTNGILYIYHGKYPNINMLLSFRKHWDKSAATAAASWIPPWYLIDVKKSLEKKQGIGSVKAILRWEIAPACRGSQLK